MAAITSLTDITVSGAVTATTLVVDSIEIDTTGATTSQVLQYDGTKFAPATISTGGSATQFKASVRAATTANITLSAPQTIDGISVIAGDRVLVKNQSSASANGIYVVAAGAWTRATDMDTAAEAAGAMVTVDSGTANGGDVFTTTFTSGSTLGTTAMNWYQVFDTSQTLAATNGGTGQTSYAVGDLLYASTTTAISKLADVATGNALISGGVGVAPSWGKIGLTTHVSGTLPVGNGGTGVTTTPTNGQILVGNGTSYTVATVGTANGLKTTTGSGTLSVNASNLEILAIMDIGL